MSRLDYAGRRLPRGDISYGRARVESAWRVQRGDTAVAARGCPDASLVDVVGPARRHQQLEVAPNHACLADEVAGVHTTRHNRIAEQQNDAFVAEQRVQCGRVRSARVSRRVASSRRNIDRFGLIVGRRACSGLFAACVESVILAQANRLDRPFVMPDRRSGRIAAERGRGAWSARAAIQQSGVDRSHCQGNAPLQTYRRDRRRHGLQMAIAVAPMRPRSNTVSSPMLTPAIPSVEEVSEAVVTNPSNPPWPRQSDGPSQPGIARCSSPDFDGAIDADI